jgi:alanine dehydrogenase
MATIKSIDAPPLHVSSQDIAEHVSWSLAIDAARESALAAADGDIDVQRATLKFEGGWMRLMAASVSSLGIFGYKEFHLTADGSVRYCIHLFETASGRPIGMVDAALVTTLRTAATAAIAVEHIAGSGAPIRLGVVGSGAEALAGVAALAEVVKLDGVSVTSRNPVNRSSFVESVKATVGLRVEPYATVTEALAGVDLVYSATNSGGRVVLELADVVDVPFIASIGSTLPMQREIAGDILSTADRIIVDTDEVFDESGDALEALESGLDRHRAELLGAALRSDVLPDRTRRTVYKSIGAPNQDIILASMILAKAESTGFGRRIEPLSAVKVNL